MDFITAARRAHVISEAIANADAHTNNAALPTYSELADALGALAAYIRTDLENNNPEWAPLDIPEYASAAALLERLPAEPGA